MKKSLFFISMILFICSVHGQMLTTNPSIFEADESVTFTFDVSGNPQLEGLTDAWVWVWVPNVADASSNINPANSNSAATDMAKLTNTTGNIWEITFTPTTFTGAASNDIQQLGIIMKGNDWSDGQTEDFILNVGAFQVTLTSPTENATIINTGESISITATNTNGNANYSLTANGSVINTQNNTTSYSFTHTNVTENQSYVLSVEQGGTIKTQSFTAVVDPGVTSVALPSGMEDGINYDSADPTKATLVLDAPNKDFIYVAGSFNNWSPNSQYAMRKDPSSSKFWLEITGLTAGQAETYQYWVVDKTPITDSPALVKTADPYSTLVLSQFDDSFISSNTYPNLPSYPEGQEREVTVLQTGQTPYVWQVTNFEKPKKEDLIIYEVLVRDFDDNRNYQDFIDRIDYFKGLGVNAIQFMPVMEFEGNESWGYNTSFHMALDKFYGTADKFKELIDLCHQNGIAVILDLAINHSFGRNPFVRMWMKDPDGDGWGDASSESPYYNEESKHSFNVGYDFNHQLERTQYYTRRVMKHWIEEFNIDGFRWDLTKGFTQNCSGGDDGCTNAYQQDRVDLLQEYADYSWSLDPTHYVIFEHLGTDGEEQQWANYRDGIMLWGKMTNEYNQLTMGFASNASIQRVRSESRGFNQKRLIGYAESHDEERLMYRNLQFGNSNLSSHNVRDLNTALSRMSALGAAHLMVPGPKMIWHFGALGMDDSIFTCANGTVNLEGDPTPGDCKLDTKPQPQWTNNWIADANRNQIYNDWAILNQLKIEEPVFEGNSSISPYLNDIRQRIYIWDDSIPASELKNVVILCNFSVADLGIQADFPYTGTWYDLMDVSGGTTINVTDTTMQIQIPAGQFRIFGNQNSTLSTQDIQELLKDRLVLYPNPVNDSFNINQEAETVQIFDTSGKLIKEFKGTFSKDEDYNVSGLQPGVYIVRQMNKDNVSVVKMVKL